MKKSLLGKVSAILLTLLFLSTLNVQAQDPGLGLRADWMRGAWGLNWKPIYYTNENTERDMSIEPFLEQIDHLETIDYIQLHLNDSSIFSSCHTAPHDILEELWQGDMEDGSPRNLIVPRASSGKDPFKDWLLAVKAKGLKTQVYVNSGQLLWGTPAVIGDINLRWKEWCDNNLESFINSKSYHTDSEYPERQYMFCYAEYILKEYSERYGDLIDAWIFDTASYMGRNGDNGDSTSIDDQRIFEAFANAARAGNSNAALAFNRGVGDREAPGSPFRSTSMFDDYTFGHPFGGAGDMTFPEVLYDYNYRICTWMGEYDGYAFRNDDVSWNDNIVGHFDPKMSTTAWNRGATPCLTNDEFVEWNAKGLINGGAISWGAALRFPYMNRESDAILIMHDYAIEQVTLMDEYLKENQSTSTFTPDPTKTYFIDNPHHNVRLAATGESEDAYTTLTSNTGDDVQWQFVAKGNGSWHVQRAAGGTKPRLRSDNSENTDMQETTSNGGFTYFDMESTGLGNTYFFTLPDGPLDYKRLQVDNGANIKMVASSRNGTWESFSITEAGTVNNGGATVVHITKRNATGFAIDGNFGAEDFQSIYLYREGDTNENQQWIEIDRGGGYYSYQKMGTDHCIDGGMGGLDGQDVYLYTCGEDNQNQHWEKVDAGGGAYKLIKRNATGFAINGGNDGANEQDVNLWNSNLTSENLQWYITPIGASAKSLGSIEAESVVVYPNPVVSTTTIQGAANSIVHVYDMNGRELLKEEILTDSEELDLSSLSIGIYYAQVKGAQSISVVKIIKE